MAPDCVLFEGDDGLFKTLVKSCSLYGEYGLGSSTQYVYYNTTARIIGVDSSSVWHQKIRQELADTSRAEFIYVDVGPVRNFGVPEGFSKRENFPLYSKSLWENKTFAESPDLVLIDGRFRIACFLTTLMEAKPKTLVLIDDYVDRQNYHIVEAFVKPTEIYKRQALFEVPNQINKEQIELVRKEYEYSWY